MIIGIELVNIKKKKIYKIKIIIDSGVTGNFILSDIISIFEIDTRIKVILYELLVVNRETINNNRGIIDIKTNELIMEIPKGYLEFIIFNIILIG